MLFCSAWDVLLMASFSLSIFWMFLCVLFDSCWSEEVELVFHVLQYVLYLV